MRHNEEHLQESCVRWFDLQYPPLRPLLHHSPNGGRRDVREAARFKRMGTRAGFPDLILLLPSIGGHFLAMELKYGKGVQTESQKAMEKAIKAAGGHYAVIRCFDNFFDIVSGWVENSYLCNLKGGNPPV